MSEVFEINPVRRETILKNAIKVFGVKGYRKASIDELAAAASISKQGLYLYFSSKQELFTASLTEYLNECVALVKGTLAGDNPLHKRLALAIDAWFGRHLETFAPTAFDVIEAGNTLAPGEAEKFQDTFRSQLTRAISQSKEFQNAKNPIEPKDIALALFIFGLSWKEPGMSKSKFTKQMKICIRVCCPFAE